MELQLKIVLVEDEELLAVGKVPHLRVLVCHLRELVALAPLGAQKLL